MRVAIIGYGKMGSWFAEELAKDNEVAVYDIDKNKTKTLQNIRLLSNIADLEQVKPGLLINAVSLQHTLGAFEAAIKHVRKDCIIADIASIKSEIPGYYERIGARFVSVHPMFGPTFANMGLIREHNAIIIKESDEEGKEFFRKFFLRLGLKIFEYSFKEHDEMMAYSLTTPFVASLVFAACVDKTVVPGTTFKKHLSIARGLLSEDNHLLSEVLFNPRSLSQLEKITSRLEFLKHVMRAKDYEEARRFFNKLRENVGE